MTTIIPRQGTVAQWTAKNTVLAKGELGVETNGGRRMWLGDGTTPYLSITAWLGSSGGATVTDNGDGTITIAG